MERAIEVVGRSEIPVAARGRVVDVLGPRIDDGLALGIDCIGDLASGNARSAEARISSADGLNARTLYADADNRCGSATDSFSSASIASGIAMNGIRVSGRTKHA